MRLLFLDVDGVLNDHTRMRNGYCGIKPECVEQLERIVVEAWGVNIVLSSAWRYMCFAPHITTNGFEYLLNIHGADYWAFQDVIHGFTFCDESQCTEDILALPDQERWEWLRFNGHEVRAQQIRKYALIHRADNFVVLDDLPLPMPELVQTDGLVGLTPALADEAIRRLNMAGGGDKTE